jgi:hypothetical protein
VKKRTPEELLKWYQFLQSEAAALSKYRQGWADGKAAKMTEIAEFIQEQRSALQMTTVGGKRIDDDRHTPPYRAPE